MGSYIARRLMLMVVAAIGVTLISFVISHAVPSDPVVANLGQQAAQRPEIGAAYKARRGVCRPLPQQYLTFLAYLAPAAPGPASIRLRPGWRATPPRSAAARAPDAARACAR